MYDNGEIVPLVLDIYIPPTGGREIKILEISVPNMTIVGINIDIPSGWEYTAGFRIENNGRQIIPIMFEHKGFTKYSCVDKYITGDDTNINQPLMIRVNEGKMIVYGVNYDSNPHRCVCTLFVVVGAR